LDGGVFRPYPSIPNWKIISDTGMALDKFEAGSGEKLESGHRQEFQTQSVTYNSYYVTGQEQ
jgi:hypothetical protein